MAIFSVAVMKGVHAQVTILTTPGPVGSSLNTDDYGVITSLTAGTGANQIDWMDYSTSFVVLDGGNPLEVDSVNATVWDGNPAPSVESGFFIPNRFEDWSFDGASTNVWHTILEYHNAANGIDLIGGIGYKLIDPSPTLGANYVDWLPAFQFTNVGNNPLTIKPFRYFRVNATASTTTYYSNHDIPGWFWDWDNIDGTSDDYAVAFRSPLPFYFRAGFPMTHYRIQASSDPTLCESLSEGEADYDLTISTDPVVGAQGEVGFQYQPVSIEENQAVLYWLYPKPIKINNSADNYPSEINWETKEINADSLNLDLGFTDTDVTVNYSVIDYTINGGGVAQTACNVTVVEITGGIILSDVNVPLHHVSNTRYWEIFYDTRRVSSTASVTFSYDPLADGIEDENSIELAFRSDYDQNWNKYDDVVRNLDENTITANNVISEVHSLIAWLPLHHRIRFMWT